MPSSDPQVKYFPSFHTLSAIRHAECQQNSYAPHGKQRTGHREVQSREPVNKVKKLSAEYML
jgi:hypothetical protein